MSVRKIYFKRVVVSRKHFFRIFFSLREKIKLERNVVIIDASSWMQVQNKSIDNAEMFHQILHVLWL